MTEHKAPHVFEAIAAVTGALSIEGVAKGRKNVQQGYAFRGIDDIYNALSPLLAQHKLCIIPTVEERAIVERATQKGGTLFYVTVRVAFEFVSAIDGSRIAAATYGEAMDSGDKATNKAMSAAYKYACMMVFAIPTEGDNDADATTHSISSSAKTGYKVKAAPGHKNAEAALDGRETEQQMQQRLGLRGWLREMTARATTLEQIEALRDNEKVGHGLRAAQPDIRAEINEILQEGERRFTGEITNEDRSTA